MKKYLALIYEEKKLVQEFAKQKFLGPPKLGSPLDYQMDNIVACVLNELHICFV